MQLARVVLAIPLPRFFDYRIPNNMQCEIGARVLVPFGNQKKVAIITSFPAQTDITAGKLKDIEQPLDKGSLFTPHSWALLTWAAQYYHVALGEVLFQSLPVHLRNGKSADQKKQAFWQITQHGMQALTNQQLNRAKKQQQILTELSTATILKDNTQNQHYLYKTLYQKQLIEEVNKAVEITQWMALLTQQDWLNQQNKLTLNREQTNAVAQITLQKDFTTWLLQGVTGSGKTEIYLQVAEQILKKGRQVLFLVPEISLTPQTIHRFHARFNLPIEVLHSHLTDNQRLLVWQKIKTAQSAIVIGTRSALFCQFYDLGCIILDEEHDTSFKQQEGWRYNARDLAIVLAKQYDIPVILGSATPSLESLYNASLGKYKKIEITQRAISSANNQYRILDLKKQRIVGGISEQLFVILEQHLKNGNQALLFLNRRGFAPVILCHECGEIVNCKHCDKPFTYHQHNQSLHCHHCSVKKPLPKQCTECGSSYLMTTGIGTEQLETTLTQRFPNFSITRIDKDSSATGKKLTAHLENIHAGKSQILIGTQMLAKGHHFPNVTLVALIDIDSALFSLDFRAEEHLAQLYIQVAGRAGRENKQGEVVLQTHYPDNLLLNNLVHGGYTRFAEKALNLRKNMGLPPYSAQVLFLAKSKVNENAQKIVMHIAEILQQLSTTDSKLSDVQLLGPIPTLHSKKAGLYRWHLIMQHKSKMVLQQLLNLFEQRRDELKISSDSRYNIDVDPIDFS